MYVVLAPIFNAIIEYFPLDNQLFKTGEDVVQHHL